MAKHIHADLITEYARLSHITDKPWEHFEVNYGGKDWNTLESECGFDRVFGYRLKPRTIRIGEYDVPEPVRVEPEINTKYFSPSILSPSVLFVSFEWSGDFYDSIALNRGMVHLEKESAELHAKALISLTKQK
ncbi:hypothetical protein HGO23_12795 [Xenorhabdus budapestensis]|uniref:Uncharacterized protein n=1 Tax=Xenorhabdus budapestensis TaxID=290110 RepID=A0ABX7VD47_XENBU|nr:hypothetical protein [Xenorhabdus budapestensis]QTL38756.1 hypothetical protein HGO23_12795 [Xenorhabdus budapestensis]